MKETLIASRTELAEAAVGHVRLIIDMDKLRPQLGQIWGAARRCHSDRYSPMRHEGTDAFATSRATIADSAESSAIGQTHILAAARTNLVPGEAITTGPGAEVRKTVGEAGEIARILSFSDANLYVPRNSNLSLRSPAPGIRRWGMFCDARLTPHFPLTKGTALAWPEEHPVSVDGRPKYLLPSSRRHTAQ